MPPRLACQRLSLTLGPSVLTAYYLAAFVEEMDVLTSPGGNTLSHVHGLLAAQPIAAAQHARYAAHEHAVGDKRKAEQSSARPLPRPQPNTAASPTSGQRVAISDQEHEQRLQGNHEMMKALCSCDLVSAFFRYKDLLMDCVHEDDLVRVQEHLKAGTLLIVTTFTLNDSMDYEHIRSELRALLEELQDMEECEYVPLLQLSMPLECMLLVQREKYVRWLVDMLGMEFEAV